LEKTGNIKKRKALNVKLKSKVATSLKKSYRKNISVLQEVDAAKFCCNKRDFIARTFIRLKIIVSTVLKYLQNNEQIWNM
jgi:hypothetical protein